MFNIKDWQHSTNAYVGGDAYNYIINSNYFTGYNVIGLGCYIITVLSLTGDAILGRLDEHNKKADQYYGYIYHHPMFKNFGEKNPSQPKDKKFSANDWGQLPDLKLTDSSSMGQKQYPSSVNAKSQNDPFQPSNGNFMYPSVNFPNNPQSMQQSQNYQRSQSSYPYGSAMQMTPTSQFSMSTSNTNSSNNQANDSQN